MPSPRRGIAWCRVPHFVERVLFIRLGKLITRTGKRNQWGQELWVDRDGREYSYCGQAHVKPVYKYKQIFKS